MSDPLVYSGTATVTVADGIATIIKVSDVVGSFALLSEGSVIRIGGGDGWVSANDGSAITTYDDWDGTESATPIKWQGMPPASIQALVNAGLETALSIKDLFTLEPGKIVTESATDSLYRFDRLVNLYVLENGTVTPPGSPADGDAYIIGTGATGAWEGYDGKVATFRNGKWDFDTPRNGMYATVASPSAYLIYKNGDWEPLGNTPRIVYASKVGCVLDSNVQTGGGTDDTVAIQNAIDALAALGGGIFFLDGPALISSCNVVWPPAIGGQTSALVLRSGVKIICPNKSCGVYLADGSNCMMVGNIHSGTSITLEDAAIIGGTWNGNCDNQTRWENDTNTFPYNWVMGMWFSGFNDLLLENVTIKDSKTFSLNVSNGSKLRVLKHEAFWTNGSAGYTGNNWDGIHMWGTLDQVIVRDFWGNGDDDQLPLLTNENADYGYPSVDPRRGGIGHGKISNVLLENIHFDHVSSPGRFIGYKLADGTSTGAEIENVIIRNVSGSIDHSSWRCDTYGAGATLAITNVTFDSWHPINVTSLTLANISGLRLLDIAYGVTTSLTNCTPLPKLDIFGVVLSPVQPAFTSYCDGSLTNFCGDGGDYTIIFNNTRYNRGDYNTSNGKFTCRYSAAHQFFVAVLVSNLASTNNAGWLRLKISYLAGATHYIFLGGVNPYACMRADGYYGFVGTSPVLFLSAGDTVECQINMAGSSKTVNVHGANLDSSGMNTFFSGIQLVG